MRRAILLACLGFAAPAAAQDTARVAVAFTLGLQGQARGWDYVADRPAPGGLARAATVLDSLRRAHPDRLVVADGGDLLTGSPFGAWLAREPRTPDPLIEALALAGYDVAVAGPRDAALGAERLAAIYRESRVPTASASLAHGDSLALRPFVVVRRGALRVAVTSVVTGAASPTGSLRARPLEAAFPVLQQMRREADVVVVVAHLAPADRPRLAELQRLADVVVPAAATRGPGTVWVHDLRLARAQGRWTVRAGEPQAIPLEGVAEQARVLASLADVHAAARAAIGAPIGRAAEAFPARMARAEPVPLVELMHRVQRRHAGTTLSLVAAPPADAGLPEGDIRRRHLLPLDPQASPVRAVRVTGDQLTALLELAAGTYTLDAQGRAVPARAPQGDVFPSVAGARYQLDLSRPAGNRVRDLQVNGRYVIPPDTFSLAVTVATAAALAPLRDAPVLAEGEVPLRELLAAEIERTEVLDPARYASSDWRLVPEPLAEDVRRHWRSAAVAGGAARGDSVVLRILSLNDFHGALEPQLQPDSTRLGGIAVLDAHMDSLGLQCRCPTLRLDAGDALQGSLVAMADHGRTVLEAYRRLGIAAASLGNHELDWGQDTLRARLRESPFPWLAANLVDSATGKRVPWVRSHAIVKVGDLTVGLVGYLPAETKRAVRARLTTGLAVTRGPAALRDVLDSVRARRPDLVVLVAHEGGDCRGTSCRGEIFELAEALGRGAVDVIVSGHSHTVIADEAGAIPIVQAGSHGRGIGVADVVRAPGGGYRVHVRVVRADVATVTPDAQLADFVEQAAKRVRAVADRPIGRLRVAMRRDRGGVDHALGNFLADAYRNLARADVALMNRGGVRADLEAGLVTFGELFAVSPFGDRIVVIELTGAELEGLLERAAGERMPGGYFYSGVTMRYDPRRPRGERLVEVRLADGRKLEAKRRYTLAVNDYVAANRETELRLWERPQRDAGVSDLEALESWFKRLPQPVNPPDTGRLRIEP